MDLRSQLRIQGEVTLVDIVDDNRNDKNAGV